MSLRSPRVAFLLGAPKIGGAERQARHLARALVARGIDVEIFFLERPGRRPAAGVLDFGDLRTRSLWHGRGRGWWSRRRLRAALRRTRPAILVAFNLGAIEFARAALAGERGTVLLPSVRGLLFTRGEEDREALRRACEGVARVSCNAPGIARALVEQGVCEEERVRLLPNLVELPDEVMEREGGAPFTVLFAGSLVEVKEPLLFVELATALGERRPEARFVVAGDGPLGPAMEAAIARSPRPEAFEWMGHVPPECIPYDRCDVVLSCSRREGTSNVILEGFAHGRPAVATRAGGSVELLEESGGGLLAEVGDRDGLVDALHRLAAEPSTARAMGRAGREHVRQRHGEEAVVARFLELVEEAVALGGGGTGGP